jgi:general stress protein YciG
MNAQVKSLRGFASMDKEKQRMIASKGGRVAHERGTAHEFNSTSASAAARLGHQHGKLHQFTPEQARAAGRKGGLARAANRIARQQQIAASGIAQAVAQ